MKTAQRKASDEEALARLTRALGALAVVLWAASCYKQSLPYPFLGALWAGTLAVLCFVLGWLTLIRPAAISQLIAPLGAAFAFTAWTLARWWADGRPTVGAENVITVLTWCAWFFVAAQLIALARGQFASHTDSSHCSKVLFVPMAALGGLAAVFAVHSILQYTVLYDLQLSELRASIGDRTPTALEMGLIHHFQLKRVASVWGDPNAFAAFCALGFGGALFTWWHAKGFKWAIFLRGAGATAMALCVAGIFLSGSRGGILDLVVLVVVAAAIARRRKLEQAAVLALALVLGATALADEPSRGQGPRAVWWKRSDTIRERLHYAEIGWKVFSSSPLVGAGPGCVEKFYGRLKTAEARESKFLHNWLLQIAAETGVLGVLLYCFAVLAVVRLAWRMRQECGFCSAVLTALVVTFLLDSFIELSYNQRELMATFSILCGLTTGAAGPPETLSARQQRTAQWLIAVMSLFLGLAMGLIAIPRALANGFRDLAESKLEAKDANGSKEDLQRALRWAGEDPTSLALSGELQRQTHDFVGAERTLRQALQVAPWSASLHVQLAATLRDLGKFDEAEKMLRAAIELYPTKAEYWYELAQLLETRGRLREAREAAEKACEFSYLYPERDRALKQRIESKLREQDTTYSATESP
ncbi:MAG: O-antigen ligase family protein [Candidatus Sumerlaeaceae bacterium]